MSSYYYIDDPRSELGYTPIPEEEFLKAIFSIAKKQGLKITDKMILKEVQNGGLKAKKSSMVNKRGR